MQEKITTEINKRIGQKSSKNSGGQPTFPRHKRQHRRAEAQTTQTVSIDQFLSAFFPKRNEAVNLRGFYAKGDPRTDGGRKFPTTRHEMIEEKDARQELRELNDERGVYFVVNSGGDKDEDINRYNAGFVESDDKTIEDQHSALDDCPLSTSIRVETLKSVHAYWLLVGDCTEEQWRELQRRLIHFFDGDKMNKNPSRVMRLPGYDHLTYTGEDKDGEAILERKRVEVVQFTPERRYAIDELLEAFPPVPEEEKRTKKEAPTRVNGAAGASMKKLPLTLKDISFDKSDPLKTRIAKLIVKASQLPSAHWDNGCIDAKGVCHDGVSNSGIWCDPVEVTIFCLNKNESTGVEPCDLSTIENAIDDALGLKRKSKQAQGFNKYSATPAGLVWHKTENETAPLCNFVAEITGEVIRDDGTEQTDVYEITASMNGAPKVGTVTAADFSSLKWVNKLLGARAIVCPNREKYVGEAIRRLSENIKTRTVVAHTGWRNDGDGSKFYHSAGAICATGLVEAEVALPSQLENFALVSPPDDAQLSKDVRAVLDDLLKVTPNNPAIMVAGVGEVLCSVFSKPDFSGFDFGTTGTRKSQIQALKQSFFGRKYTDENLPESWRSSEYALETFASKIKDASGCIDEFKPEGTGTARDKWHTKADYVLRGAANKQGRTTLRQDRSERPARIPQGMLFCSGEELPIGESLRARLSIKEYDEKTVDLERLTIAQKQAAEGVYVRVMSAFIQWLATDNRVEKLREQRDEEIARRRQEWLSAGVNSHGRTANNNAHLEWAWDTFFAFADERKVTGADDLKEYRKLVFSALDTHGRNQARYLLTANDALKFVEFIQNAIVSGKVHLTDLKGSEPTEPTKWGWERLKFGYQPRGVCIGAIDGDEIYLLPDESYRM